MTASTQFNYGRRNSNVTPYTIPTTTSKPHHNHTHTHNQHHHHHEQQSPIMSNYQLHHHHHSYNSNNSRHNNNHNNTNHHQHQHQHQHQNQNQHQNHIHSHSHSQSSAPSSGQFISSPPLSASVPTLSREFVVRRISEGETGRLKEELRCEACGKGYKHISSLAKHLWEHTPEWNVTKKLLISKHQQVQLLEAASILVGMNENNNGNNGNGMIQSQHQQAVQRHINQQHSKIKSSSSDINSNGGSPYSPPNSNNSTPSIINTDDHISMNHEENSSISFKNGYHSNNSNNNGGKYEDDEEEEDDDDDDTEDYDGQNRLNRGRLRSISHEPPIYEKHEVTSPILESEQNNGNKYENSSNLKSPNSTNYLNNVKSELPVKTNFSVMNENKKETYVEESVIGTMEA
ncbi:predicted protein [Candida tropicalis MYA-3404]|uniref:C2H2-type domain-containing protein n=1 Tax=Candida tropicalis (strain ATCC MYA-3404 / T1) TaxID=294747 RepID=C5MDA1_CANTT|nr:predicted protein [Candida tropicalis MYA-3404]EER32531.1 predicted protein [Candida tropicalis MYA-3404]KAG4406154.1 hypothetical protein JTP64_005025 [Candida tropicalis]